MVRLVSGTQFEEAGSGLTGVSPLQRKSRVKPDRRVPGTHHAVGLVRADTLIQEAAGHCLALSLVVSWGAHQMPSIDGARRTSFLVPAWLSPIAKSFRGLGGRRNHAWQTFKRSVN